MPSSLAIPTPMLLHPLTAVLLPFHQIFQLLLEAESCFTATWEMLPVIPQQSYRTCLMA